jgi:hypothetical protein
LSPKVGVQVNTDRQPSERSTQSEPTVDTVIMNVYSRVKNLENRYIDLANFYKEALIRQENSHNRKEAADHELDASDRGRLLKMTASPRGLSSSLVEDP